MAKNFVKKENVAVNARNEIIKAIADNDNLNRYIVLFLDIITP